MLHCLRCYVLQFVNETKHQIHKSVWFISVLLVLLDFTSRLPLISSHSYLLLCVAPCTAGNVVASYGCNNNTAEVSWSYSGGASSYIVTAVSLDGYRTSCNTSELRCELLQLECSQTYNITLTTGSNQCQIEKQTGVSFSTRKLSKNPQS